MVYINDVEYTNVLDVTFKEHEIDVQLPEWINDDSLDIDTNVWSRKPRILTYTLRVTHAEKWVLDQLLNAHASTTLTDEDYGFDGNVWLSNIEAEYIGHIDNDKPWNLELTFIVIPDS